MRWVALPLEFVDWMAAHFNGKLIRHLRQIDPYNDILIPKWVLDDPIEEVLQVRQYLEKQRSSDIPTRVDIEGDYGLAGALRTTKELMEFFEFTMQTPCRVISVGD